MDGKYIMGDNAYIKKKYMTVPLKTLSVNMTMSTILCEPVKHHNWTGIWCVGTQMGYIAPPIDMPTCKSWLINYVSV